jgi:single-stranded-DNA-specific exonuclease
MGVGRTDRSSAGETTHADQGAAAAPAFPTFTWDLAPELPLAELDAAAPHLTRLQVQVLANRGVRGAAAARAFVESSWRASPPDPLGLDVALERLRQAQTRGERVVVFGDYDADGITSCAVMYLALRVAGCDVHAYLPARDDDGRGLNEAAVRELAGQGTRLIVTTDCGTANVAEVELATALGMDTIITDHHPPMGALPAALAVINPRQPDCPSTEKNLAGIGVAFRLAEALLTRAPEAPHVALLPHLLDLVAVGTIGDIVPLTRENWALAHAGMGQLNTAPRPGLRALAALAGLRLGFITERDISFAIAPRLNAAGRMGHPRLAFDLLVTEDPAEANALAGQLQQLNEERQRATESVMAEARAQVRDQMVAGVGAPSILVARGAGWPLGIIGLAASRLVEEFGLPALVVSLQGAECRGSARAPVGFNLVAALAERADLFRRFGGHAQAAGFTLSTADLATLVAHLNAALQAQAQTQANGRGLSMTPDLALDPDLPAEVLPPDAADVALAAVVDTAPVPAALHIDCRLPLKRVTPDTYASMRALRPFGPGFPEPVFVASRVRIVRCWRSGPDGRTLRLRLRDNSGERVALWSRNGHHELAVRALGLVDVAYTLSVFTRPDAAPEYEMRVVDLRQADGAAPAGG